MRAVVQRTRNSRVTVDNQEKGSIGKGVMVLLGIGKGDTCKDGEYIMDKILNLRIFEDENGKMNYSLLDIKGEMLLVSQFTLYGDVRKGRRPSFTEAANSEDALPVFNHCLDFVKEKNIQVATGEFGANMIVDIQNDGPCTILLDSERLF